VVQSGKDIDRRRLLQLGAAASGLLVGCGGSPDTPAGEAARPEMRYRPVGATGLKVSELTFGSHGVDNPPLMQAALEAGVTTFFTSGEYLDGREEIAMGTAMKALGVRRQDVVIITGSEVKRGTTKGRVLAAIDGSLRRLGTDHIDVYTTFEVCSPADLQVNALYEAFAEARKAGKVGHLALSGHCGGMQPCLEAAIADGRFEVLLFKYDFVSYPDVDEILRRAAEKGIGAVVFKTNAGARHKEIRDLEAGGLSFQRATVKWALGNPDISSVAVTITNFRQIRDLTAAVGSRLSRPELAMLRRYAREMGGKYCRFCTACEASCPAGVAVADVMRYAMYFTGYGREKEAMQRYREMPRSRTAAACDGCPAPCESACRFGRSVRSELVAAHRMLSFADARG
jgi:aryl-alcohol dehydrogenase-like predicted oxidoreductase